MTKQKQLKLLCGILICVIAIYVVIAVYSNYKESKASESETFSVMELEEDTIQEITYTSPYGDFSFELDGDNWTYAKDEAFPLNQSYVEGLITEILDIKAERELSETDALEDYGLDEPSYSMTVVQTDGTEVTCDFGDMMSSGSYYMTVDGGKTIYVSDGGILESLLTDENDFLQLETFPVINDSNIVSLQIKANGNIIYDCSDEEDETLCDYAEEMESITLESCVAYNATKAELAEYGLASNQRKTIKVKYKKSNNEKSETFYISSIFEENNVNSVYLQLKDSNMVYQVDTDGLDKLID